MFESTITSGLSFTKIISGISKTLNIANQVIPLYKEAKPMINNAKNILSVLKEFNNPKPQKTITNNSFKQPKTTNSIKISSPTFFL